MLEESLSHTVHKLCRNLQLRSQLSKEINKMEAKTDELLQVNYKNVSQTLHVMFQSKRGRTMLINVSLRGMESSYMFIVITYVGASLRYWLWKISSLPDGEL
jgi:hypothetical protein